LGARVEILRGSKQIFVNGIDVGNGFIVMNGRRADSWIA
jgi:hypothetical protein